MFEFKDFDYLTNGEIDLQIEAKIPAEQTKGHLPAYEYKITLHGEQEKIGRIGLRIGFNEIIRYGGNIGYAINESYRGKHYAAKACALVKQVALAHGMNKLLITCDPDNIPSRKTCERIGADFIGVANLPPSYIERFREGKKQKCVYEWAIDQAENTQEL